jgi:hypothetical protein
VTLLFASAENTNNCFPLNILMVYSPKLTFIANGNNLTGIGFTPRKTICFGSLEVTTGCFSNLSLFPEGEDSCAVFIGMMHSGSSYLHTILKESFDEGNIASNGGGSSGFTSPRGCNVVTPTVPIATTPTSPAEMTGVL